MNYKFGVYGDSIAYGYGNNSKSWFDILFGDFSLKQAQNGEKIADVLYKIKQDSNYYDTLFIAVGINDLLISKPKISPNILQNLINDYKKILESASTRATQIIVQSVLPVREELFPHQAWLDENKWAYNSDIMLFNQKLSNLCAEQEIKYLDTYNSFSQKNLANLYVDAVHLNQTGQNELATLYTKITFDKRVK